MKRVHFTAEAKLRLLTEGKAALAKWAPFLDSKRQRFTGFVSWLKDRQVVSEPEGSLAKR